MYPPLSSPRQLLFGALHQFVNFWHLAVSEPFDQVVVYLNRVLRVFLLFYRKSLVEHRSRDQLLNRWYVAMSEPRDQVVVGLNLVCGPVLLA